MLRSGGIKEDEVAPVKDCFVLFFECYDIGDTAAVSDPVFFTENKEHRQAECYHQADNGIIPVFPV